MTNHNTILKMCLPLLQRIQDCHGCIVVAAADLIQAGAAIEGGYAWAEDDYEGPRMYLTEAGEKALRLR